MFLQFVLSSIGIRTANYVKLSSPLRNLKSTYFEVAVRAHDTVEKIDIEKHQTNHSFTIFIHLIFFCHYQQLLQLRLHFAFAFAYAWPLTIAIPCRSSFMGKSSKKRRLHAKRRRELDKLRGVSLSPGQEQRSFESSPNPENASHLKNYGKNVSLASAENEERSSGDTSNPVALPIGAEASSRKRIEFVLPRSFGKAERYIFDKQATDVELPTIYEDEEVVAAQKETKKLSESIDDILFPQRKRKLGEKFEDVYREENKKEASTFAAETAGTKDLALAQKKERRLGCMEKRNDNDKSEGGASFHAGKAAKERQKPKETIAEQVRNNNGLKALVPGKKTDQSNDSKKEEQERLMTLVHKEIKDRKNGTVKVEGKTKLKHTAASASGQLSGLTVKEAVKDKHGLRPRANSTDGELNLPQRGLCDERMVLQAHKWNDEQNYVHQLTHPIGFRNVGNTCFLNSILQCLAYLPPFCQSLVAISEAKKRNGVKQKLSQGQRITSILCNLFQNVHGSNGYSVREGALTPNDIVQALPTIGTCGSRNGYKFRPGRQEDAHEFLVHLLDAMHDGELRAAGINQHVSGWRDRLPVTRLDETTFIHRIFGGYFRSQVRCRKCGYRSNTYDPFLDLSLEVSKKSSNSVLYALSEFTRKETLDSDNQWRCSGCNQYVCATKQLTVFRPPLSLCIQLKRFTFDSGGSFFGSNSFKYGKKGNFRGGSKITKPIEFPAELDLPLSDSRSCSYVLTGVVSHVGGSASSGHYTAYVQKPGMNGANQWYHADDSFVEPVSERTVLRQKDAYVLFYRRKEVKLEFPSPPHRGMSAEAALEFGRARAKARADSITQETTMRMDSSSDEAMSNSGQARSVVRFRIRDGAVKREKPTIHPSSNPTLAAEPAASKSTVNAATSTSLQPSPRSSFPDEHLRTTTVLGKDLLRRISEQPRSTSTLVPLAGTIGPNEKEEKSSQSSDSEESLSEDERKPKPIERPTTKRNQSNEDTSSSSESDEEDSHEKSERKIKTVASLYSKSAAVTQEEESSLDEDSESDDTSSSDDDSSEGSNQVSNRKTKASVVGSQMTSSATANVDQKVNRTRVVMGRADSRGKVKVMLGPRKKRRWAAKATTSGAKGAAFDLLGNMGVSRWDDEDDNGSNTNQKTVAGDRNNIVQGMEKQERSRKRRMFLDRWDSILDQGKVRKLAEHFTCKIFS